MTFLVDIDRLTQFLFKPFAVMEILVHDNSYTKMWIQISKLKNGKSVEDNFREEFVNIMTSACTYVAEAHKQPS